jgi:hypothetical protein
MSENKIVMIIISFAALLFAACEKQTSWNIQPSGRFIVADCILTSEFKNQKLKLYYSSDNLNQQPEGVSGAIIEISDGKNQTAFIEIPDEPGKYVSATPFMASAGNIYRLVISADNITDTAFATMSAINPLESIEIIYSDSLYRFVYHESSLPSMTEVCYDWSSVPDYCNNYGSCQAAETFYTLDNIDVNKIFAPDKLEINFPRGTQIIRIKYSLNDEYQKFIRSLLIETEWRGGIFDTEQGNVPTNFSGKIRGWFAVCMVLTDTTNFD